MKLSNKDGPVEFIYDCIKKKLKGL